MAFPTFINVIEKEFYFLRGPSITPLIIGEVEKALDLPYIFLYQG